MKAFIRFCKENLNNVIYAKIEMQVRDSVATERGDITNMFMCQKNT